MKVHSVNPKRDTMLLFQGVPDDRNVRLRRIECGRQGQVEEFVMHGMAQVDAAQEVWPGPVHTLWFNTAVSEVLMPPKPHFAINLVADPDRSRRALEIIEKFIAAKPMPVLNEPQSVLASDRVSVADALRSISGIRIPPVCRVVPQRPSDIFDAMDLNGLEFPILVRNVASHGGNLVRLDSADDADVLFRLEWGGRAVYITQFEDFQSADGLFRKYRLMVIGDQTILRHVIIGDQYLLRMEMRLRSDAAQMEEAESLKNFSSELGPNIAKRVETIRQRLRLDMFGIDFAMKPNGDMLVFEANPAMNFFFNPPGPNIWDAPVEKGKAALFELLSYPDRWYATQHSVLNR